LPLSGSNEKKAHHRPDAEIRNETWRKMSLRQLRELLESVIVGVLHGPPLGRKTLHHHSFGLLVPALCQESKARY
jgi:hypothetical protein